MPKSMQENQRSFKVAFASGLTRTEFGRYIGVASRDAARKALRQVLARSLTGGDEAVLALRETTQWAKMHKSESSGRSGDKDDDHLLTYFYGYRTRSTRQVPEAVPHIEPIYEFKVRRISAEEFRTRLDEMR